MIHVDFAILNSYVTVVIKITYILLKNHLFLFGKTEKLKTAVFFPTIHPCI